MNEQEWKWYAGPDGETFTVGPLNTREQAIAELDGEGGYVILARKVPIRLAQYFDASEFLESAEERAYELANEYGDPLFEVGSDEQADLEVRVRAAIDAWQYAHGLKFMPWSFSETKKLEKIE